MTRQQRAMLLTGLLLISAVLLGRTGLADAAQSSAEHATALESETSPVPDPDRGLRLTLGDVLFEDGGASLTASSAIAIERLAQFMRDANGSFGDDHRSAKLQ